jgi:hypothetical protein
MAYHIIHECTQTIRQSPMRAALACVLLITTSIYVSMGRQNYRVAEIGDSTTTADAMDLTINPDWLQDIEQVGTDPEDLPATTTHVDGHEQYIDARLTHAVAEINEAEDPTDSQFEQVSGVIPQRPVDQSPVWLLGVLNDD